MINISDKYQKLKGMSNSTMCSESLYVYSADTSLYNQPKVTLHRPKGVFYDTELWSQNSHGKLHYGSNIIYRRQ